MCITIINAIFFYYAKCKIAKLQNCKYPNIMQFFCIWLMHHINPNVIDVDISKYSQYVQSYIKSVCVIWLPNSKIFTSE